MADTNIKAIIDQAFMQSYGVNFDFVIEAVQEKINRSKRGANRHVVSFFDEQNNKTAEMNLNEYCKGVHVYPVQIFVVNDPPQQYSNINFYRIYAIVEEI